MEWLIAYLIVAVVYWLVAMCSLGEGRTDGFQVLVMFAVLAIASLIWPLFGVVCVGVCLSRENV